MARKRFNSKLEAMGAEHLVLGQLLIDGIPAYLAYGNQRDYDVIAVWPEGNRSCTIQVKSRWATDANLSFPISKLGADFVVFVALNRGVRYRKARADEEVRRDPDFYVVPMAAVREHHRTGSMSVLRLRDLPDWRSYLMEWEPVRQFLEMPPRD